MRARRVPLALSIAGALVLTAGCSTAEEPQQPPDDDGAVVTSTAPATAAPGPAGPTESAEPSEPDDASARTQEPSAASEEEPGVVEVAALPGPIARAVQGWYDGGDVTTSGAAQEVADAREPLTEPLDVEPTWAEGAWGQERIGVVTAGDDVTLLVRSGSDDAEWRVVGGWWPSLGLPDPALGGPRHVLLIGSDARVDQGQAVDRSHADAIQVVGVDGQGGGGVLGIARDAWVPIPAGFEAKINAAMVHGGPDAQVEAVSDVTGLPIEGYVLSGFDDMRGFVDDWGGLQMDVPAKVRDIEPGEQVLGGYDAFWYGRERYSVPGGDFGRSANQGLVLGAIGLQVRGAGPEGLPEVLTLADSRFSSDLDAEAMLTVAAWAYAADPGAVGTSVAKGDFGTSGDGQSIVLLDDTARADFEDFADGNLATD